MWGVALGLLISSVAALNVTTAIVLQLGESIAGVAGGLTQTDVSALSDFGAGVALTDHGRCIRSRGEHSGCSKSSFPY